MRGKITEKNKEWIELCEYVKLEILRYDDNMKFPSYLALKLKGLKTGNHIANNNIPANACYDDYTILCTFKLCKKKILDYIDKNETKIKDENHRINLIMKIIEPEINDVYLRIQHKKQSEEKFENTSYDNQFEESAIYKPKTSKPIKNLENLL